MVHAQLPPLTVNAISWLHRAVLNGRCGSVALKHGSSANPQQVSAMARVVTAYCKAMGIDPSSPEGEHVADIVLALHDIGLRGEGALLGALIGPSDRLPMMTP